MQKRRSEGRNGTAPKWFLDFLPNLAGLRQIEIIRCFVSDKPRWIDRKKQREQRSEQTRNTGTQEQDEKIWVVGRKES